MTILQQPDLSLEMKILLALFGYLAVTALPFLAFASPLAATNMDYDGYVNSTQNHALLEKGLGNIVETSAQYHKDSALIKRVPGEVVEARQVEVVIPVAFTLLTMIADLGLALWWISGDKPVRGMM